MAGRDADRPNLLVVLTDDQGPWALGHRNPELITPEVDGLVANGVEFDRFFCASPVCSLARASLLLVGATRWEATLALYAERGLGDEEAAG